MYKITENGGLVRLSDNAFIPNAPGNRDWDAYQKWLQQGNTPEQEDHTIRTYYNIATKEKIEIKGPIPEGYTNQVPKEFDYWDGSLWITDITLRNTTLKARKMAEINQALENTLKSLRVEYPESEIMSWSKQENEARRWLADNTSPTPMIDNIVEIRGVDKITLVNKIILKADQYTYAIGMSIGRRQYLEDRVLAVAIGNESELSQYVF